MFDTVAAHLGKDATAADEAAARAIHRYWVAFARTGKPEPHGEPPWPAYRAASDVLMHFTERGPVAAGAGVAAGTPGGVVVVAGAATPAEDEPIWAPPVVAEPIWAPPVAEPIADADARMDAAVAVTDATAVATEARASQSGP